MASTQTVGLPAVRPLNGRSIVQLLKDIFQSPQFWDGIKVFGVGAAIAGSKWIAESAWDAIKSLFLAKAVFRGGDDTFQWAMHYLTSTGQWSEKARDVEILCRPGLASQDPNDPEDGSAGDRDSLQRGRHRTSKGGATDLPKGVNMFPLESTSLHFVFQGVHVFAVRDRKLVGDSQWEETLSLSFLTLSSAVIRRFIAVSKQSYDEHQRGKVQIFSTDRYNYWSRQKSITKRLSDSVHLPSTIKETLLQDASHFIHEDTKLWYGDRGLPYRRGYLLYGPPGTGKTSLAHVLASELELPIYQCNLNAMGMDDSKFQELMTSIPAGVVILLEDVDVAFANRTAAVEAMDAQQQQHGKGASTPGTSTPQFGMGAGSMPTSRISFSSLLNAIDGIGASDSRILVMTTNHRQLLDEALIRPGRVDLEFAFKNADKKQIRELFVRWYAPPFNASQPIGTATSPTSDQKKESEKQALDEKSNSDRPARAIVGGPFHKSSMDMREIQTIADEFAENVPEYSLSIAALQGYLLTCSAKTPKQAADGVKAWMKDRTGA